MNTIPESLKIIRKILPKFKIEYISYKKDPKLGLFEIKRDGKLERIIVEDVETYSAEEVAREIVGITLVDWHKL